MGSCRLGCIAMLGYYWFLQWFLHNVLLELWRTSYIPVVNAKFESLNFAACFKKMAILVLFSFVIAGYGANNYLLSLDMIDLSK